MELTSRQSNILMVINNNPNISGKEIASILDLSLRTIQNETKVLKELGYLESGKFGYRIIKSVEAETIKTNIVSEENRIIKTIIDYDAKGMELTIDELCEQFYLSESAIKNRLKPITALLKSQGIELINQAGTLTLIANELEKRQLIKNLLYAELPENPFENEAIEECFPEISIKDLMNMVKSVLNSNGYYVQSPYVSSLLLGLCIGLYRIMQGIHSSTTIKIDNESSEYKLAEKVVRNFEKQYNCTATKEDISYIANLFQGNIIKDAHFINEANNDSKMLEEETRSMINEVFDYFSINLDPNCSITAFTLHIQELIKRGRANNYVKNSGYISMRNRSPFIYEIAVMFSKKLEERLAIHIPDDEIGFLAIHLGMMVSGTETKNEKLSILLYASNYRDIANRIRQSIEKRYEDKVDIIHVEPSLSSIPSENFDLIITTEHIDFIGKEVVDITPFYDMIDASNVDEAIARCLKQKELKKQQDDLMDCFDKNLFFIDESIDTSEKAIRFLGQKMIDMGVCEEGFIDSVFEREAMSPTSFFDAFAIPHSIKMNAKKTMFAVLINNKGIEWNYTSVRLCIMIAISREDLSNFSNTYNGAVRVLCDNKLLSSLLTCKNITEFKDIFVSD